MDNELKKIRRHNRIIWLVLLFLVLLTATGIFLNWKYRPVSKTTVENFAGQQGQQGNIGPQGPQGVEGYTPVKGLDYVDGAAGPQGPQGVQGEIGATGATGQQGDQGPTGDTGQDGRNPEFRCSPKNHNYEWRYVGDDSWQVLQKNSLACQSGS